MSDESRTLLVDASVFITLAAVDATAALQTLRGELVVPSAVRAEISDDPAKTQLSASLGDGTLTAVDVYERMTAEHGDPHLCDDSARRLGKDPATVLQTGDVSPRISDGDVALLAAARLACDPVVLTDDKPLRKTCKSLSIPVSGSIGILVRAVETGAIEPKTARATLYAMDEVGARLSARLVRRAEQLIEDASEE